MTNPILVWKAQIENARQSLDDEYKTCLSDPFRDRSIGVTVTVSP
jgi:hypothetical protein